MNIRERQKQLNDGSSKGYAKAYKTTMKKKRAIDYAEDVAEEVGKSLLGYATGSAVTNALNKAYDSYKAEKQTTRPSINGGSGGNRRSVDVNDGGGYASDYGARKSAQSMLYEASRRRKSTRQYKK